MKAAGWGKKNRAIKLRHSFVFVDIIEYTPTSLGATRPCKEFRPLSLGHVLSFFPSHIGQQRPKLKRHLVLAPTSTLCELRLVCSSCSARV